MLLKEARLSIKLYSGFGILVLLLLVSASIGYFSLATVIDRLDKADDANRLVKWALEARRHEKNFIIRRDPVYIKQVDDLVNQMLEQVEVTKSKISEDEDLKRLDEVTLQAKNYHQAFKRYVALAKQPGAAQAENETLKAVDSQMVAAARKVIKVCEDFRADQKQQMMEMTDYAKLLIPVVSIIAMLAGIFSAWAITRAVNKPLQVVIAGIEDGSMQVAMAATQVSGSSQSLAEGSSQQAAALEQTSASMEQMAAMTHQNADNSEQADAMVTESDQIMAQANQTMQSLLAAMAKISANSGETAKIIKTIDEIAFQTNLLALNAAVEAARAGEVGAGFAVVADEVRNLAMRAAEASRNIGELIKKNITETKEGSELVEATERQFKTVTESSQKIARLISEIAQASQEQSQGIGQINQAISEMDNVTQQVANSAEETAAASEELSAQAKTLHGFVEQLSLIVQGANGTGMNLPANKALPQSGPRDLLASA